LYIVHFFAEMCSVETQTVYKLSNSLNYIHQRNQSYFVGRFIWTESLGV